MIIPRYRACRADVTEHWEELYLLRLAVEHRLHAEIGSDQWDDTARGLEQMAVYVNNDEMYLVRFVSALAGAFALTERHDRF
jgi:hypothetical protein